MKTTKTIKPTSAKTRKVKKPAAAPEVALLERNCQAREVGHRRCNCGGPDCGANIGGR